MASLNLAGKTSGYVKVTAPDDSSTNPTVVLPKESGELALKSDITGGGGGIPEAPIDGKQYARKDADWSEVEATSGGGGDVEAQPPVAFNYKLTETQKLVKSELTTVKFEYKNIDTDNSFNTEKNSYVAPKTGLYQINVSLQVVADIGKLQNFTVYTYVNDAMVSQVSDNYTTSEIFAKSLSDGVVVQLEKGDEVTIRTRASQTDGDQLDLRTQYTQFSGHMVSSITEGEVKEKEAVVFEGFLPTNLTSNKSFVKVNLNSKVDTEDSYNSSLHQFNPKTAGYYQVNIMAKALYNGVDATIADLQVRKNGAGELSPEFIATDVSLNERAFPTSSSVVYLNGTTDYLEMYARHSNGGDFQGSEDFNFTSMSAHLITGQSSGGSGGGESTDILPVLMSGTFNSDGDILRGEGFSVAVADTNKYTVTFDTPIPNKNYSVNALGISSVGKNISISNTSDNGFLLSAFELDGTPTVLGINFTVTGTETIAVGGSGGGSYTPEKMVWEDKLAEREFDTEYTNTNEVPLYIQLSTFTEGEGITENAKFEIDGNNMGWVGSNSTAKISQAPLFVVPSGSTYKLALGTNNGTISMVRWHEARMPVAVGTGGDSATLESLGIPNHDKVTVDENGNLDITQGSLVIGNGEEHGIYQNRNNVIKPILYKDTVDTDTLKLSNPNNSNIEILAGTNEATRKKLTVRADGFIAFHQYPSLDTVNERPNLYINGQGIIYRTTNTTYSVEEVDKKLAIKDKLIEKLSDRLDKLEKKLKKAK